MRFKLLIVLFFYFTNSYSQIDIINYKTDMSFQDLSKLKTDYYNIIQGKISIRKYFNFHDSISDSKDKSIIEAAIFQHDKFVQEKMIKTKYSESEHKRIDSLKKLNDSPVYRYKILGKLSSIDQVESILVLRQKEENKFSFDGKQLYLYLLNLDNNNQMVSSALIGRYEKMRFLSFLKVNAIVTIDKDEISIIEKIILVPTDICQNCKKKDYSNTYKYIFTIKNNGELYKIK